MREIGQSKVNGYTTMLIPAHIVQPLQYGRKMAVVEPDLDLVTEVKMYRIFQTIAIKQPLHLQS